MSVTPQFWMIRMDLMEKQHPFNTAAQKGKFGGKMCAWEFFLPFFFSINKHNYARHGSWYKHQKHKKQIHYTAATRSSLFNRKQDTTSTQLLNSEESNHWIRMPKPWAVLEDSLLTMMHSLIGPWGGLNNLKIWIPCCKCALSGNSTMCTTAHGLHKFWSQNHASQMLLQFWRMSLSTRSILH